MNEAVEARRIADGIEAVDESTWARTESREEAEETRANRSDATVSQSRREQPDDLAIVRIVETADDPDGIAIEEAPVVPPTQIFQGIEEGRRFRRGARHTARISTTGASARQPGGQRHEGRGSRHDAGNQRRA